MRAALTTLSLESLIDQRFAKIDNQFTTLEEKLSRQFLWILGVQMTTLVASIATVVTAMFAPR